MATVLKKTDVAIVGFGWVGAIMAKELTEAGLNVVALERGPMRDTWPDGAYPQVIDELTYNIRLRGKDISKDFIDALRCRNGNLTVSCGREADRDMM